MVGQAGSRGRLILLLLVLHGVSSFVSPRLSHPGSARRVVSHASPQEEGEGGKTKPKGFFTKRMRRSIGPKEQPAVEEVR